MATDHSKTRPRTWRNESGHTDEPIRSLDSSARVGAKTLPRGNDIPPVFAPGAPSSRPEDPMPPVRVRRRAALPPSDPALAAALKDLEDVEREAQEEGFPVPTKSAFRNANQLVRGMYKVAPRRYLVYPTPDNEIAIDAPGGYGRSVILFCDSDGSALCLVNMNGKHRHKSYPSSKGLPDSFIRDALIELRDRQRDS